MRVNQSIQEIENTYEFKLIKRTLMRTYPWIKNVSIPDNYMDYSTTLFLDLDVDAYQLQRERGWPFSLIFKIFLIAYDPSTGKYSLKGFGGLSVFNKNYTEYVDELVKEMNNLVLTIREGSGLPTSEKILTHGHVITGKWKVLYAPIPPDAIFE